MLFPRHLKWMKSTLAGQLRLKPSLRLPTQQVYTITAKAIPLITRANSRLDDRRKITLMLNRNVKYHRIDGPALFGCAAALAVAVPARIAYETTRSRISCEVRPFALSDLTRFLLHCRFANDEIHHQYDHHHNNNHHDKSTWPKVELDWICTLIQKGIWRFWRVTSCVLVRVVVVIVTRVVVISVATTLWRRREKDCPPLVKRMCVPCAVVP